MNRAGVKRRLVDLLGEALGAKNVAVHYTWDGDTQPADGVHLGPVEGRLDPESIGSHETLAVDTFVIPGVIYSSGHRDGLDAESAVERVLTVIDETLRTAKRLRLPPHPDGDTTAYAGVRTARLGQVDGPWHTFPHGDLVEGRASFEIDCTTDLP